MVSSLEPKYSPTPLPGYVANNPWAPGPNGAIPTGVNHPAWQTNLITALATDWASGGSGLPGGWDPSFGTPDPSDTNGKPSARTIQAFTKYVQAYQPGKSEWIDANYSYVPPGPGDYVESPETVSLRVAQENWEKEFDVKYGATAQADKAAAMAQHQYEFNEQLKLDQARLAMQGSAQASEAAYQSAKLSLEREGLNAEAAWRKAQIELEREKIAIGEDQFNRNLALQYEQLWLQKEEAADRRALAVADIQQKRANTLAELGADPGDAVQREFFARLGTEPLGTPVDVFSGQAGATDSKTLSQVMADQAEKLRPFAQRGFAGAPVNNPSGLVTDPVAVVGDSPDGRPTGAEEILVNPTNAPFGILSNKDTKKMGLNRVIRGYARGTGMFSYGNDNRSFPTPPMRIQPMPSPGRGGFSDLVRQYAQRRPIPRYADGTIPGVIGVPDFSTIVPDIPEPQNPAVVTEPIVEPVVTTQNSGPVQPVAPLAAPAPAPAAPKWELVTAPDGKAVWYDATTKKYFDPNTGKEIPSPAGMTNGKPDPVTLPAPKPPTPPTHRGSEGALFYDADSNEWAWRNGTWIFQGNRPGVPPTKPPMTTPGSPNALVPYFGGWWDPANGPVPTEAPPMNAAPTTGFVTRRQHDSLANPQRLLSSLFNRHNRDGEGGTDPATDTTLPDGTVVDRNGRTRGRVPLAPPTPPAPPSPPAPPAPPAGGGNSTGNPLLDALLANAGIDILSYGPEVYQALARLLNTPGISEQLAASGISVPALGLTGDNALPAPNALNFTNLSELQQGAPQSFALLSSLFKAGNQSLPNLMAAVAARAPRGSAYRPSLIQT